MTNNGFNMKRTLLIIFIVILMTGISLAIFLNKYISFNNKDYVSDKKITILMYHRLMKDSEVDENKFKLGYEGAPYLYIRKESQFLSDMEHIKNQNYQVISLYDLLEIKNKKMNLSGDAVIITFDDGSQSQYDIAFPILKNTVLRLPFLLLLIVPMRRDL